MATVGPEAPTTPRVRGITDQLAANSLSEAEKSPSPGPMRPSPPSGPRHNPMGPRHIPGPQSRGTVKQLPASIRFDPQEAQQPAQVDLNKSQGSVSSMDEDMPITRRKSSRRPSFLGKTDKDQPTTPNGRRPSFTQSLAEQLTTTVDKTTGARMRRPSVERIRDWKDRAAEYVKDNMLVPDPEEDPDRYFQYQLENNMLPEEDVRKLASEMGVTWTNSTEDVAKMRAKQKSFDASTARLDKRASMTGAAAAFSRRGTTDSQFRSNLDQQASVNFAAAKWTRATHTSLSLDSAQAIHAHAANSGHGAGAGAVPPTSAGTTNTPTSTPRGTVEFNKVTTPTSARPSSGQMVKRGPSAGTNPSSKKGVNASLVKQWAEYIGIDPQTEPSLFWIAEEAMLCELPDGWEEFVSDDTGAEYYHHYASGETQWEHPLLPGYRNKVIAERAKKMYARSV